MKTCKPLDSLTILILGALITLAACSPDLFDEDTDKAANAELETDGKELATVMVCIPPVSPFMQDLLTDLATGARAFLMATEVKVLTERWDESQAKFVFYGEKIFPINSFSVMDPGSALTTGELKLPMGNYRVKVSIYNFNHSLTEAVVSGTTSDFWVTWGDKVTMNVVCTPVAPIQLQESTSSGSLTLDKTWTMDEEFRMTSTGDEQWFIAITSSSSTDFRVERAAYYSSEALIAIFVYDDGGYFIDDAEMVSLAGNAAVITLDTNPGDKFYIGVVDYGNPEATDRSFTLSYFPHNEPPSIPVLIGPANDSMDVPLSTVVFTWEPSIDPEMEAVSYDVTLWDSDDERNLYTVSDLTETSCILADFSLEQLSTFTTYNWKIKAKDSSGEGPESTIWSFTTGDGMAHALENWDFTDEGFYDSPASYNSSTVLGDSIPGWLLGKSSQPGEYAFEVNLVDAQTVPANLALELKQSFNLSGCELIASQTLNTPLQISSGTRMRLRFRVLENGPQPVDLYDTAPLKVWVKINAETGYRLLVIKNTISGSYTVGSVNQGADPATNLIASSTWYEMDFALDGYTSWNQNHSSTAIFLDSYTLGTSDIINHIRVSAHNDWFQTQIDYIDIYDPK